MKSQRNDRRSRRTQQLLGTALVELMLEKKYESITVQDIIDHADVGRSTFYAHYLDKEDLLATQFERIGQQVELTAEGKYVLLPILEVFRHAQEQYRLFSALFRGRSADLIFKVMHEHLDEYLEIELQQKLGEQLSPIPLPIVAHYTTGAFLTLLKWWLEKNMPIPPEEMDDYFRKLVIPGLEDALHIKF